MYILLSVNKTCFPSRAPCYNAINLLMTLLNLIAKSDVMIVAKGRGEVGWVVGVECYSMTYIAKKFLIH